MKTIFIGQMYRNISLLKCNKSAFYAIPYFWIVMNSDEWPEWGASVSHSRTHSAVYIFICSYNIKFHSKVWMDHNRLVSAFCRYSIPSVRCLLQTYPHPHTHAYVHVLYHHCITVSEIRRLRWRRNEWFTWKMYASTDCGLVVHDARHHKGYEM